MLSPFATAEAYSTEWLQHTATAPATASERLIRLGQHGSHTRYAYRQLQVSMHGLLVSAD